MTTLNLPKNKICVVDDDESIREIYRTKLNKSGFDVVTADDGEQGLEVIRREKPDLALIDINMPKKNGIELIKDIRADKDIFKTRIIILTNFDDAETIKQVEEYNVHFYIVKANTTPQKVVGMIKEALNTKMA